MSDDLLFLIGIDILSSLAILYLLIIIIKDNKNNK